MWSVLSLRIGTADRSVFLTNEIIQRGTHVIDEFSHNNKLKIKFEDRINDRIERFEYGGSCNELLF